MKKTGIVFWSFFFIRKLMNWSRTYLYQHGDNKQVEDMTDLKRWERDYQLERLSRLHLFDEYIEMSKYICNRFVVNECL